MVRRELLDLAAAVQRPTGASNSESFKHTESTTLASIDQQLFSIEEECTLLARITQLVHSTRGELCCARLRVLNSRVPIGRIPDEILSYVFQFVINEVDVMSYNFTSTSYYLRRASILSMCSKWLSVAVNSPGLWAYVRYDWRSRGPLRLAALHVDLARSRLTPLHIDIRLPQDATQPESASALILFGPHLHRCWSPVYHFLPIDVVMSNLEYLLVSCSNSDGDEIDGPRSVLSIPAPNLQKLLVKVNWPLHVIVEPHHIRPTLITHLTISANCAKNSAWTLLTACKSLVRLCWRGDEASRVPTTKVRLQHLHTLILYHPHPCSMLKWIEAPKLLNLNVGSNIMRTQPDVDIVKEFPSLKYIHVDVALWTTPYGLPQFLISHPQLEYACLTNFTKEDVQPLQVLYLPQNPYPPSQCSYFGGPALRTLGLAFEQITNVDGVLSSFLQRLFICRSTEGMDVSLPTIKIDLRLGTRLSNFPLVSAFVQSNPHHFLKDQPGLHQIWSANF